jgi:hypothetical protein
MILVDEEDQDVLHFHNWRARADGYVIARRGRETLYLHREVMKKHGLLEDGKEVDHVDKHGPKGDCRKSNLRMRTHADNLRNSVDHPRGEDLPKGVYFNPSSKHAVRYFAQVQHGGRTYYLGSYDTPDEASQRVQMFYKEKSSD